MDNPELEEQLKDQLAIIREKAHRCGLNYWQIKKAFEIESLNLTMLSEEEYNLKVAKGG